MPLVGVDRAVHVVHGDDLRAGRGEDLRRRRADVPEALHDHARALEVEPAVARPLLDAVDDALAGGADAPLRAADARVLAGDDAAELVVLPLTVGELAHHVGHDLPVRPDVGRRDVEERAHEVLELVDVTQRDVLDLLLRVVEGVDLDAALRAAERDLRDRGLPGHVRGERLEEVERDVLVVAHAALVRAAHLVVLDAVRLELPRAALLDPEEAHLRDVDDALPQVDVGAEERAAVQDEVAVRERLERVRRLHVRRLQVLELRRLLGRERHEPVAQLGRDVEDVLEVRLLQLHPDARVQLDELRRAIERLHRLVVEALLAVSTGHRCRPRLVGLRGSPGGVAGRMLALGPRCVKICTSPRFLSGQSGVTTAIRRANPLGFRVP